MSKPALCVIAGCCGAFLAGAVAFATTQTSTAVIHGCYSKKSGVLRRISSTGHCRSGEKTLKWNVQGIQGLPGTHGPDGTKGADGTDGTNGTNGTTIQWRPRVQTPTAVTLTSGTAFVETPIPVTNSTWTQGATELEQIIGGTISITTPNSCNDGSSYPTYPSVGLTVYVDGNAILNRDLADAPLGATQVYTIGQPSPYGLPEQVLGTLF